MVKRRSDNSMHQPHTLTGPRKSSSHVTNLSAPAPVHKLVRVERARSIDKVKLPDRAYHSLGAYGDWVLYVAALACPSWVLDATLSGLSSGSVNFNTKKGKQ